LKPSVILYYKEDHRRRRHGVKAKVAREGGRKGEGRGKSIMGVDIGSRVGFLGANIGETTIRQ